MKTWFFTVAQGGNSRVNVDKKEKIGPCHPSTGHRLLINGFSIEIKQRAHLGEAYINLGRNIV